MAYSALNVALVLALAVVLAEAGLRDLPAISRTETRDEAGQFSLQYQTADGSVFGEQGTLKKTPDGTDHVLVKQGYYYYTSPEGRVIQVKYSADEFGFHPESESIPVAPSSTGEKVF